MIFLLKKSPATRSFYGLFSKKLFRLLGEKIPTDTDFLEKNPAAARNTLEEFLLR
jgi:hypothetical protein